MSYRRNKSKSTFIVNLSKRTSLIQNRSFHFLNVNKHFNLLDCLNALTLCIFERSCDLMILLKLCNPISSRRKTAM